MKYLQGRGLPNQPKKNDLPIPSSILTTSQNYMPINKTKLLTNDKINATGLVHSFVGTIFVGIVEVVGRVLFFVEGWPLKLKYVCVARHHSNSMGVGGEVVPQ